MQFGTLATMQYDAYMNAVGAALNKKMGNRGVTKIVEKVIGIAVGLMVIGIVLPMGLDELAAISVPAEIQQVEPLLKVLLPVLAIVAIVFALYKEYK